jgi:hypothetical protein
MRGRKDRWRRQGNKCSSRKSSHSASPVRRHPTSNESRTHSSSSTPSHSTAQRSKAQHNKAQQSTRAHTARGMRRISVQHSNQPWADNRLTTHTLRARAAPHSPQRLQRQRHTGGTQHAEQAGGLLELQLQRVHVEVALNAQRLRVGWGGVPALAAERGPRVAPGNTTRHRRGRGWAAPGCGAAAPAIAGVRDDGSCHGHVAEADWGR